MCIELFEQNQIEELKKKPSGKFRQSFSKSIDHLLEKNIGKNP